jgi:nitrile hydratase
MARINDVGGVQGFDTADDAEPSHADLVLPRRPEGTEGLAEEEPAALVTRNALIGTAAV